MSDQHQTTGAVNDDDQTCAFDVSRETFQSLVDALPLSLLIKDRQGRRLFANRMYLENRALSLDQVVGMRDEDLFPSATAERLTDDDERVMRDCISLHDVEETVDAEGNRRCIERIKSPIFKDDQVIGMQLMFWDVTDRVTAEVGLQNERDLLRTLLSHIPDSIFFKDRESKFIRISDAMAVKLGFSSADAAIGMSDADVFSKEHAEGARRDEIEIMETGRPFVDQVERETWPNHEDTWCMSTKMPLVDKTGQVIGTFGISRDITELKKSQTELLEARDLAERASRAKSDFLANMSHEIRTPMNAIMGMSELLSQTNLTADQHDQVQIVRDAAESLLALLNDILDFSKIEAGKLELETAPFSLRDLLEKTARSLALRAAEKDIELACRVAPDVPDRWLGDQVRLRQIMTNLIGNALKFTDHGEVVAEVRMDASESGVPGQFALQFSVRDTGIGIPKNKQEEVLGAFTQADASTTRRFGGTGLGLAISKQLVELMKSNLLVESEIGVGTKFSFTADFVADSSPRPSPLDHLKGFEGMPVLVVDDNATNREILGEILSRWQFTPTLAEDGPSAIRAMHEASASGQPFPLVITDCSMPEMDGFSLCERIRDEYTQQQTKLVVLSSATRSNDPQSCARIGISRDVSKPIVQSELLDVVLQILGIQEVAPTSASDTLPACPPLRVLVAEDGIANQHVAVGMLHAGGHESVVASDGREAIARWQSEKFDVILMDMHMPVTDGLEATRHIRTAEQETGEHITIIALTAAAMKEDAEACRAAGMDDYLSKPIHPRKLQETLARYAPEHTAYGTTIERRETGTASQAANVGGSGSSLNDRIVNDQLLSSDESIDLRAAASRLPGGLPGVRRLADVFIPECESLMTTMREELPDGEQAKVQRAAHTLKGSSDLFRATGVTREAEEIERLAKEGDLQSAALRLLVLEEEVQSMLRALRNFLEITSD